MVEQSVTCNHKYLIIKVFFQDFELLRLGYGLSVSLSAVFYGDAYIESARGILYMAFS